jgi:hypothetical protein
MRLAHNVATGIVTVCAVVIAATMVHAEFIAPGPVQEMDRLRQAVVATSELCAATRTVGARDSVSP